MARVIRAGRIGPGQILIPPRQHPAVRIVQPDENGTIVIARGIRANPELIVNGDFSSQDAWVLDPSWTIAGGEAICDGLQGALQDCEQLSQPYIIGDKYECRMEVVTVVAGSVRLRDVDNALDLIPNQSIPGLYVASFTAISTTIQVSVRGNATFQGTVDNVSITRVP